LNPYSLEDILYAFGKIPTDDLPNVAAFIRRCLTLDPAARPSAPELLNNKWLEGQ
jgi:serine/threonine-protein kinase SRPK3